MVGDQIKFDPAWVTNPGLKVNIKGSDAHEAKKSISGGINMHSFKKIRMKNGEINRSSTY
jgi:hypothetical protein